MCITILLLYQPVLADSDFLTESSAENSTHSMRSIDVSSDDSEDVEAFVRVHLKSQSNAALLSNPPSGSDNTGLVNILVTTTYANLFSRYNLCYAHRFNTN